MSRFAELADPEWLRRVYLEEGIATSEIAARLGCTPGAVRAALQRHEIARRPRSPAVVTTGERFGRLVVLDEVPTRRYKQRIYRCLCDCGTECEVLSGRLRSGGTRSCGCLRRDMGRAMLTTHGRSRTPTHNSYNRAKQRCTNPTNIGWPQYGGRGIEFRYESFKEFFADMGERPAGATLDRVDPDGHYEPGNCRWATSAEQRANQRPKYHLTAEQVAVLRAAGLPPS